MVMETTVNVLTSVLAKCVSEKEQLQKENQELTTTVSCYKSRVIQAWELLENNTKISNSLKSQLADILFNI